MSEFIKSLGPVIFFATLIICFEIVYHRKKSDNKAEEARQKFWNRESKANSVRKQDITFLNYLEIPVNRLPFMDSSDEELSEYEQIVKNLSHKKILNLSGKSNTDLKLEYGPANLAELTSYDENYITLVGTIAKWGARLYALDYIEEGTAVLEYGISIGSDVGRNFYLLADRYRKDNMPEEIDRLIDTATKLDSIMKKPILKKLKEIRSYLK